MLKIYKKISIKSLPLSKYFLLILTFVFLGLSSCQLFSEKKIEHHLTEREELYEKGLALFNLSKYSEASLFFLKVTQVALSDQDEVYNNSLWHLSFIYEKYGEFDKAIFAVSELESRRPLALSPLMLRLSLMKNYIRVANFKMAFDIRKKIDSSIAKGQVGSSEVFKSLYESTQFNYDLMMKEELQFLGEIQKYFIQIMESNDQNLNEKTTNLLITLYNVFFKALEKDQFKIDFRKLIAAELLDQLRRFDGYKLDYSDSNKKTIDQFSKYSQKKQKYLIDWLHK